MSRFLIGQVCTFLGVRPHVLRYWERHVDLLSPAKDRAGRRLYTLGDVQLLSRLKYLVQNRGMSVEGASRQLVEEVQGEGENRKATLEALRGDLLRAALAARDLERLVAESGTTSAPPPTAAGSPSDPADAAALIGEVSAMGAGPDPTPGAAADRGSTDEPVRIHTLRSTQVETARARESLADGGLLVLTPAAGRGTDAGTYPGLLPLLGRRGETVLDRIGSALGAMAADGIPIHWRIEADGPVGAAVAARLSRRGFYGLSSDTAAVLPMARGGLPLAIARAVAGLRRDRGAVPGLILLLPVTNALPRLPDLEFIAAHLDAASEVSAKVPAAAPDAAPDAPRATGEVLLSTHVLPRLLPDLLHRRSGEEVRRSAARDDILEAGESDPDDPVAELLRAAHRSLRFEVDPTVELAALHSLSDWDSCSSRVRAVDR